MQRRMLIKSISLTLVALSLAGVGTTSVHAAADAPTVNTTLPSPFPTPPDYGDINKTRITLDSPYDDNTRDIGGYRTSDGKWQIRAHRLIRSANLHSISDNDIAKLKNVYHVTSIVDFRTPGQTAKDPDRVLPGVPNTPISVLGPHAYGDSKTHPVFTADFSKDGFMYIQRLEFGQPAVAGYSKFLNMLLANPNATLYHCSSGKDRTGIATALIMEILGMSHQTIINDYMQSQQTGRDVRPQWINEYYHEILSNYKSMQNYITTVLNFSPAKQERLRSMYLVSTDGKNTPYPAPKPTVVTSIPAQPAAAPTTTKQSKSTAPVATTPAPVIQTTRAADKAVKAHKAKHAKIKILSTKKRHTKYVYRLKANKKWFKDAHLRKLLGHTPKHKHTSWRILKVERIKLNGKKATYYQIQDHAGHKAWIAKNAIFK